MRSHFQPVKMELLGDINSKESFCASIINGYKNSLVGKDDIFPAFFGRKKDYVCGIVFTKQISNTEDEMEIVSMIKEFLKENYVKEILFMFQGIINENNEIKDALMCLFFDDSDDVMFKTIETYKTNDGSIFGFSESEFSLCQKSGNEKFGILTGIFDEGRGF